jgi:hypothetical protein
MCTLMTDRDALRAEEEFASLQFASLQFGKIPKPWAAGPRACSLDCRACS